jgi:hypothetical protein
MVENCKSLVLKDTDVRSVEKCFVRNIEFQKNMVVYLRFILPQKTLEQFIMEIKPK